MKSGAMQSGRCLLLHDNNRRVCSHVLFIHLRIHAIKPPAANGDVKFEWSTGAPRAPQIDLPHHADALPNGAAAGESAKRQAERDAMVKRLRGEASPPNHGPPAASGGPIPKRPLTSPSSTQAGQFPRRSRRQVLIDPHQIKTGRVNVRTW